jgi:hypothetical protein
VTIYIFILNFCASSFLGVVLGAAPNGGPLIGWPKAGQACLTALNIKAEAISECKIMFCVEIIARTTFTSRICLALLTSMFPNRDGSNGDVNAFVQFLRFDASNVGKVCWCLKKI